MTGVAEAWLRLAGARITADTERLTRLDAAIGDGDHGINLARGFRAILAAIDGGEGADPGAAALLALAGRVVLGTVGGASGALYGRAFARAGAEIDRLRAAAPGPLSTAQVAAAFDAAVAAITSLGRSTAGQKTMLDALVPAAAAVHAAAQEGIGIAAALVAAADAAEAGAASTVPLLALRGRASYLGERSRGHLDPGAASTALLVRALADAAGAEAAANSVAQEARRPAEGA